MKSFAQIGAQVFPPGFPGNKGRERRCEARHEVQTATPTAQESTVRATDIHTRSESSLTGNGLHEMARGDSRHGGGRRAPGPRVDVRLEPGATAAGEARAALASLEGRIDHGVLDDIRLLVSELVTNSVRHSGADRDLVVLAVMAAGNTVRVEVSDAGTGFRPVARSDDLHQPGGWGLHLVDELAHRWGVETGRRTRVWFEIDA